MIFETNRLLVEYLRKEDLPEFYEMQGNPNVMRYTGSPTQKLEEARLDLDRVIGYYKRENNGFWVWAVRQKLDNSFLGTCAIIVDENNSGEIGYRLLEHYWGNGYGLEITQGLVQHGFNKMQLDELVAYVNVENVPSVRILEKSDFEFVKEYFNEEEGCTDRMYCCKR
jgi:ribosomal-protein-alanine N-acetyltransferase